MVFVVEHSPIVVFVIVSFAFCQLSVPCPRQSAILPQKEERGTEINIARSDFRQLFSVVGGGLPGDFFEDAIEVGERLEADFIGDFTHAQIRIEQEVLHLFDAEELSNQSPVRIAYRR